MTRREMVTLGALVLLVPSACRKKKLAPAPAPPVVPPPHGESGRREPPAGKEAEWKETGIASWYGYPYHGRRAANGEIYDMNQLTAAHRTLPFGAIVRVTSLTNDKSVTVRITDRGPFIEGRIIDLSRQAAREIDMIGPGIMKVRIEVTAYGPARLSAPAAMASNAAPNAAAPRAATTPRELEHERERATFAVQVGLFNDKRLAERLRQRLQGHYQPIALVAREGERTQWRVLVGDKPDEVAATALAAELRHRVGEAMVVRRDVP
jgi:rare lipoprotein A